MLSTPKITRKPIKHLYLRIDRDGELHVSAPKHIPDADILAFIAEKRDWIAQKQRQRSHQHAQQDNSDHSLTLFGQSYPIERQRQARNHITMENGICRIGLTTSTDETKRAKLVVEFYRQQLLPVLHRWVAHYQPIIGVAPTEIRTKNMKTKWGTCNTRAKRLWFNVQLARFSERHIAYVVVHEMVHLLEPSHNQRFYRLVEQAMPDWETYHRQLKGEC